MADLREGEAAWRRGLRCGFGCGKEAGYSRGSEGGGEFPHFEWRIYMCIVWPVRMRYICQLSVRNGWLEVFGSSNRGQIGGVESTEVLKLGRKISGPLKADASTTTAHA